MKKKKTAKNTNPRTIILRMIFPDRKPYSSLWEMPRC